MLDVFVEECLEEQIIERAKATQVCLSRVSETSIDVLLALHVLGYLVSQGFTSVLELNYIVDNLIAEFLHLLEFCLCFVNFFACCS